MAYSAKTDMLKRISQTELDKLTGSTDSNLTDAIASADSMIDSYLASASITTPLATAPKIIMECSLKIAMYLLQARVQYIDRPEWVKTDYDDTIKYLESVANGKVTLDIDDDDKPDSISFGTDADIFFKDSM